MIETERLRLRLFRPTDLDDHYRLIYGDAEVMRYIADGRPRSRDETRDLILSFIDYRQSRPYTIWAVERKADGAFVGHCGLIHLRKSAEVEIAYAFGKPYWGQGYATEAAYAAMRYGFEQANLPQLIALAYPQNIASQRVMQKLGMTYAGESDDYHGLRLALYKLDRASFTPNDALYAVQEGDSYAEH